MADSTYRKVLVWPVGAGGAVKIAPNQRITVTDPKTGLTPTGLKQQGQPVPWATSDANGTALFTTDRTVRVVDISDPAGRVVERLEALEDIGSAAQAAADAAAAQQAAQDAASLVGAPAKDAMDAAMGGDVAGLVPVVAGKVGKGDIVVNVRDHGAKGDGTTLDHAAINGAIAAGAGRTVYLPAGTYLVDAVAGIKMWTPGVRLLLDPGATIKAQPNSAAGYSMIEVNAADCVIEGGTIQGDGTAHTGTTGEQGHCIVTAAGASRLRIQGVRVTKAWGDGIALQGGAADVSVIDCEADDNRRQGMSIIAAVRPRVVGGVYKNTGVSQGTAPMAGIDVEPNAAGAVTDCTISGVMLSTNKGPGLQIATAAGSTAEVTVTGCRSTGNSSASGCGFYVVGPAGTIKAKLTGCHALNNAVHGFALNSDGIELSSCTARANTQYGVQINASYCTLVGVVSRENGRVGIQISGAVVDGTTILGGLTHGNSQAVSGNYVNFDNWGVNTRVVGLVSDAGTLAAKPAYGFLLRASSTARLIGCDARGAFTAAAYSDGSGAGNSPAFPVPGVAKQALAAAATDAATTQTLANSLRTALINLGYGA